MQKKLNIAVLIGSLRKQSYNRMLAGALARLDASAHAFDIVEIGDLPFYNEELEASTPASWQAIRQRIADADAVLFLTPEYNRSVPAVLKNAVDVLSRPYGKSALTGKPAAVISSSQGALGGFGANHHLRQSLVCLGVNTMPTPEAYIGGVGSMFDQQGNLTSEPTRDFLQAFMRSFEQWITMTNSK